MNVFIMTDFEGITNVDSYYAIWPQTEEHWEENYRAREDLMRDVNASVAGFFDGGADHVYVADGHYAGKNFIHEMLDERAEFVGRDVWESYITERKVDIHAEIGSHAMAGTINGFLDHSQSSNAWFDFKFNGRSYGEIFHSAAFVGAYDIPVVMVSGDVTACEQARQLLGDIETAVVKRGVGRNKAISVPSEEARKRIYEAAKRSIKLKDKIKPLKVHLPGVVTVTYMRTDFCDEAILSDKIHRTGPRTVEKYIDKIENFEDMLRMNAPRE